MTRTMMDWTSEEQIFLCDSGMMFGCSEDQRDLALQVRGVLAQLAGVAPEEISAFLTGKDYLALLRARGISEKTFEKNFYAALESLAGETVRYSFPVCVAPEILERTFLQKLIVWILRIKTDRLPSFKKKVPVRIGGYLRDSYHLTMGSWTCQVIHFWLSGRYAILAGIVLEWPIKQKATLSHLKKFPNRQQVRRLSCYFTGRQKGDFTALADYSALRELNLRDCMLLNDNHLRQISALTNLKGLEFQFLSNVTEKGMSCLEKLIGLEDLLLEYMPGSTGEINGQELPPTALAFLTSLKNLRRLVIPESFLSAPDCPIQFCFPELKQLECLNVNGFVFDGYFKNLEKMTNLKLLILSEGCYLSKENAHAFANMPELRELEIWPNADFSFSIVSMLQKNEKLQSLRLNDSKSAFINLEKLGLLTSLVEITVGSDYDDPGEMEIKGEQFASFENLQKLERIYISNAIDWDGALEHFRHLSRLNNLSCANGVLSGKGMEYLSECRQLRYLTISADSSFNDDDLRKLSKLAFLTKLGIDNCQTITGAGFQDLESCGHLQSLSICYCKGLNKDFISSVKRLKGLKRLEIYGSSQLKKRWLHSMEKDLPDCQIRFCPPVRQTFWNSGWEDIIFLFKPKFWLRSIIVAGLFFFSSILGFILAGLWDISDTPGGTFGIVGFIIAIFLFLTGQMKVFK